MFLHMWAVYQRLSFMPNWWRFNFHAVRKIIQIRSTDCFQSWICRVCNFGRGICWKHGEQKHHRKTELSGMCNCSKNFREWKRTEREVNSIAPAELNKYLAEFIYSVHRRKDGEDYEPLSLRCLVSRIEMHLKKHFIFCAHWILYFLRKGRLLNLLLSLLLESQSLVCIRNLTRSPRSLVRFLILIIKITIYSIVIGLKNSYFLLIHLPSCYRTVCYWIVCYWTVCYRTVQ